jgi:hypothetical protein
VSTEHEIGQVDDAENAAHPALTTVRQPLAQARRAQVSAPRGLIEATGHFSKIT